jgi:glutaredoxin
VTTAEPLPPEVTVSEGVRVVVLGKPGCHLCDDAKAIVAAVCADIREAWEEHSIEGVPRLEAAYGEKIPVIFVDGVLHDYWRVDPARLRKALG